MITKSNNLLKAISKDETKKLTYIVNETLAYEMGQMKTFTAADLWNIQRQKRSTLQRRYLP